MSAQTDISPDELVKRWFGDLFTHGDLTVIDELVAPDIVAHGQGDSPDGVGREAFRSWFRWFQSAFTDPDWQVHDVIVQGQKVVARYSGWTTYRGGFLDIPSDDQRVLESGILIFRVADGQIKELWAEMSDLQVAMQLGALSLPKPKGASGGTTLAPQPIHS